MIFFLKSFNVKIDFKKRVKDNEMETFAMNNRIKPGYKKEKR